MRLVLRKLWDDDCGASLALERVFLATLLILGIVTGLVAVRQAVISEMTEFANALMAYNDSFSFSGTSNCLTQQNGGVAFSGPEAIQDASVAASDNEVLEQSICD